MHVLGFISTEAMINHRPSDPCPPEAAPLWFINGVSNAAWHLNCNHMQIKFILQKSGYSALQESGIPLQPMFRGESLPVTLHLFTPFIIGDTESHDQLCGHYKSCTTNVKQLF
jgi:hypothetical protein